MINIILCGGSGTRLWPLSRTLMPKQFVKLFDDQSLFQKTVSRNQKACDSQFIVSNAEQYFLAVDQIEEMAINNYRAHYLLEPVGRNTAPAIALSCLALDPEEIVLVTPSDHLIKDESAYLEAIDKLENDIMAKMDGCYGGNLRNDWITDCATQAELFLMIGNIIDEIADIVNNN